MYRKQEGESTRTAVSIIEVHPSKLRAAGRDGYGNRVVIDLRFFPGGVLVIPKLQEQWIVERSLGSYHLVAKASFQDQRNLLDLEEGDVVLGTGEKVKLFGTSVEDHTEVGLQRGQSLLSTPPLCKVTSTSVLGTDLSTVDLGNKTLDKTRAFKVEGGRVEVLHRGVYDVRVSLSSSSRIAIYHNEDLVHSSNQTTFLSTLLELDGSLRLEVQPSSQVPVGGAVLDLLRVSD